MRKRYDLEVTEADIEAARLNSGEGDSYKCMVVESIKRQVPGARRIEVDVQTVRWTDDEGRHAFLTPYEVAGYVIAFDDGDEMLPFAYRLTNPVELVRRVRKTDTAKQIKRARNKIDKERIRKSKAEATLADSAAPADRKAVAAARVAEAPARIADAEQEHESVKAAYAAATETKHEERVSESTRRIPKSRKLRQRVYGQRVLRVNQGEGRTQVH